MGEVETGSVADRRAVRFASPEEALRDAEMLAAAEEAGRVRCVGNWTVGQALGHIAAWIEYSFDGYPLTAPSEMAERARPLLRTRVLDGHLRAGFRVPGVEGGTAGIERVSAREGLGRLRRAWERLGRESPGREHPFFGAMERAEWVKLQLRHSELHQSFFHVE